MKIYKLLSIGVAGLLLSACNQIDEQDPMGGELTAAQLKDVNLIEPSRAEATFGGMFSMMGQPCYTFGTGQGRADDFGFIAMALSQDTEGPDATSDDSGYNWFSTCGEYTSRQVTYANPRLRYSMPYNQINIANEILSQFADRDDEDAINKKAQARAIRAFDYMALAPYFQFNYQTSKDKPCVPIVTPETPDPATNPRATVGEVYELIMSDLNYAVENLTNQRSDKSRINQQVAYGLRARANLAMGNWAEAAADAEKAAAGYTPYSIEEVSTPSFYDIKDHSWIWGIDVTKDMVIDWPYQTSCSWIGSFSANAYAAAVAVYLRINVLLWNKIPETDVRKGWWVDENLHSPLLSTISWAGVTGDAISTLEIDDVKMAFQPYTNVKFGMMSGIGSDVNDNDFPLMRVEEMILIQAEGLAKSGQEGRAREILENFVKTYRDPEYNANGRGLSLENEIWFQRRVELWGEGFGLSDCMRLQKPIVRFHDDKSNYPAAFRFNIPADDPWLLMRFPQSETNANLSIVDNKGGQTPEQDQHPELRDGVTD
jgi:hypothetical protein